MRKRNRIINSALNCMIIAKKLRDEIKPEVLKRYNEFLDFHRILRQKMINLLNFKKRQKIKIC